MDKQLIEGKLESLRRCINRVETKRPKTFEELENNLDLQDILSVNLERSVQLCVDIGSHISSQTDSKLPTTMAETFDILANENIIEMSTAQSMKKAVGFRNIAVHNYQSINWEIVFNISHHKLDDFKTFAKEIDKVIS